MKGTLRELKNNAYDINEGVENISDLDFLASSKEAQAAVIFNLAMNVVNSSPKDDKIRSLAGEPCADAGRHGHGGDDDVPAVSGA